MCLRVRGVGQLSADLSPEQHGVSRAAPRCSNASRARKSAWRAPCKTCRRHSSKSSHAARSLESSAVCPANVDVIVMMTMIIIIIAIVMMIMILIIM